MQVWVDAQISPAIAEWLRASFGTDAVAVRDIGLRDAPDIEIFERAQRADAAVLTKDADFVHLLHRHGPPPQVVWLTCGNTSNARLRAILSQTWPRVTAFPKLGLEHGEALVEVTAR